MSMIVGESESLGEWGLGAGGGGKRARKLG